MPKLRYRLLFVEDDRSQRDSFEEAVSDWNQRGGIVAFTLETATNYEEGLQLLYDRRYHGVLLDLRLPGGPDAMSGSDLAEKCVTQYGVPVGIISGNPRDFDTTKHLGMLAVFDKLDLDAYERAIEWFGSIERMMNVIAGTKEGIQHQGSFVFANQVWPRWRSYEALSGIDDKQLIDIVSRQYASHIAEILGGEEDGGTWHPFENYVQPALHGRKPHTGDIFRIGGELRVILTPQCDMATEKAKVVLLAACTARPSLAEWNGHVEGLRVESSSKKRDAADKFFRGLINQAEPAFHFLPPLEGQQPLMVDFKDLSILSLEALNEQIENRVASIAAPFLGNLTQRFGAYVSRMGQPNIDAKHFR